MKRERFLTILFFSFLIFLLAFNTNVIASKISWQAGTSSEGTAAYVATGIVCEVVNRYAGDYINMIPIGYTGTTVALKGYNKGELQSAIASFQQIDLIKNESGPFDPDVCKWTKDFEQLTCMFDLNFFCIIRKEDKDKIKTWSDISGKKVFAQMKGSSGYEAAKVALGPDGLNIWDKINVKQFHYSHAADALKLKEVDAILAYTVARGATIVGWAQEVFARADVVVLSPTPEEMKKIEESAPYFMSASIGTEVFEKDVGLGGAVDLPSPTIGYIFIVDPKIEEEYVYQVVKAMFEHADELAKGTVMWNGFSAENSIPYLKQGVKMGIPLHSGTKRYYKELGYDLKELGLE